MKLPEKDCMSATARWMGWWKTGTILAEMVEDIAESMETTVTAKRWRAIFRGPTNEALGEPYLEQSHGPSRFPLVNKCILTRWRYSRHNSTHICRLDNQPGTLRHIIWECAKNPDLLPPFSSPTLGRHCCPAPYLKVSFCW